MAGCGWQFTDTSLTIPAIKVLYMLMVPLQYLVPCLPIVVSCGISSVQLWKESLVEHGPDSTTGKGNGAQFALTWSLTSA